MNKRKTLIITHMEFPPVLGGSVRRLWGIYEWLIEQGHDVSLCWVSLGANDPPEEMRNFWKDRLYIYKVLRSERSRWLRSVFTRIKCLVGLQASVDAFIDKGMSDFVADLHQKNQFSTAIAEYVFMSDALTKLPPSVLRLIDTHDSFANRLKLLGLPSYPKRGFWNEASYTHFEEGRGLNRADRILACTTSDAELFRKHVEEPVIMVSHRLQQHFQPPATSTTPFLLFVASAWNPNIQGILWFIESVWPEIRVTLHDCQLVIVGSISPHVPKTENVQVRGKVDDLEDLYRECLCVINPVNIGTGAAIKTIEALSFGRPVMGVPFGFRGLESFMPNPSMICCSSASDFGREIFRLRTQTNDLDEACRSARDLFIRYTAECNASLDQAFAPDYPSPSPEAVAHQ